VLRRLVITVRGLHHLDFSDSIAGLFVPFFFSAQFAEEVLHTSPGLAFDVISVMNAGSVIGRPIPGLLADLVGCYNLSFPSLLIGGLLILAVWLTSHSVASLMCFAAFYGMFSGIFIALSPPCLARISRLEEIGTRVGLLYAMLSFPYVPAPANIPWFLTRFFRALVGGPIAGAILVQQRGSFDGLRIFAGVSMLLGGCIFACVKFQINRKVWAKV
jgi:MFS family permease